MKFSEARAQAESLVDSFRILANRMTEDFPDELGGKMLYGHADVWSPDNGGPEDYEVVGLLGFGRNMVLMDATVLTAPQEVLRNIAVTLHAGQDE